MFVPPLVEWQTVTRGSSNPYGAAGTIRADKHKGKFHHVFVA